MRPLTAHLKQLYQCRLLRIAGLFLAIFAMPVLLHKIGQPKSMPLAFALMASWGLGTMIARLAADSLGKPFTFCLPNHEKTVHRMLLIVWMALAALFIIEMAALFFLGMAPAPGIIFGISGLLSISYWLGIAILTRVSAVISPLFYLAAILDIYLSFIESILLKHPWWTGILCGTASLCAYAELRRGGQGRRFCNRPLATFVHSGKGSIIDFIPRPKIKNSAPPRAISALGRHVENRIRHSRTSALPAALWGQLYLVMGAFLSRRNAALLVLLFFPFLLGICSQSDPTPNPVTIIILSLMAGIIGGAICAVHHFEFIMLQSRKVRLIRSMTATLASTLFITGVLASAVLCYNGFASTLPEMSIRGKTFQILPLSWIVLAFTIPLVPVFGGVMILFKHYFSRILALCLAAVAVIIISSVSIIAMEKSTPGAVLAGFLAVTAISWGFDIGALYYDSHRRSLC
jgi:hypothetical protein